MFAAAVCQQPRLWPDTHREWRLSSRVALSYGELLERGALSQITEVGPELLEEVLGGRVSCLTPSLKLSVGGELL